MRGICDRRSAGAHLCEGIIFRQSLCNSFEEMHEQSVASGLCT